MSAEYIPPEWLTGEGQFFKVTASQVSGRNGPWTCPGQLAHDARAKVGTVQLLTDSKWFKRKDVSEQLFFALRDGLDAIMDGRAPQQAAMVNANLTHTQRRFVTHALHELCELPELIRDSVGSELGYQGPSEFLQPRWGQVSLTGPEFADDDDAVREAVKLGYTPLREPVPEHLADFVAVAAMVLASRPERRRIRVSEFSLADGNYRVHFDGTPAQARELYASRNDELGRHLVAQAVGNTELNPGSACGGCRFLPVCTGPQRLPSALGIDTAVASRGLSSTDLAIYDDCPTRFHAQRRSHLPARYAEGGAADDFTPRNRGIATHRFLAWAHARTPHRSCTEADLPDPALEPEHVAQLLADAGIDAESYALARPYLLGHLQHCIVGFDGLADIEVEPRHVIYDEYADVVLTVEPDLTLRTGPAAFVWRETKTRGVAPPRDELEALEMYPAFAVHVVMLAAGAGGNARDGGAAELEVLTPKPADSALFVIEMSNGALVAHAQKIVTEVLLRWSQDLRFAPRPSGACARCPMHGWCEPPDVRPAVQREPDDGEFLGIPDPF